MTNENEVTSHSGSRGVTRDQVLAEGCPQCYADPGDPCHGTEEGWYCLERVRRTQGAVNG